MKKFPKFFIGVIMTILFIPIVLTFLYSIATNWHSTVIPEGITFKWYAEIFRDSNFTSALIRTFTISAVTVALSITIMVPTVYIIVMYFPKWERAMQSLVLLPYAIPGVICSVGLITPGIAYGKRTNDCIALLPYAIPGVICSVGLIQIYSKPPFLLSGTVWILIGAYFIIILPFMYQGIRNSLRNINVVELVQAAEILGASKTQTFLQVILPNILSGIIVSSLLSFSMLFGEFVMTNFLVGGRFETVQIYLKRLMDTSGHMASAIVISYFLFILIITSIAIKISKISSNKKKEKINDEELSRIKNKFIGLKPKVEEVL